MHLTVKPFQALISGDISKQSSSPLHHIFLLGHARFTAQFLSALRSPLISVAPPKRKILWHPGYLSPVCFSPVLKTYMVCTSSSRCQTNHMVRIRVSGKAWLLLAITFTRPTVPSDAGMFSKQKGWHVRLISMDNRRTKQEILFYYSLGKAALRRQMTI